jgi:hypothetical protein
MDPHNNTVQEALAVLGLAGLKVIADAEGIAALEQRLGCQVPFAAALGLALRAFLADEGGSDGRGHDTAVAVVRSAPDAFGLGPEPSSAEISAVLRQLLADDPQAKIALLTPAIVAQSDYRFLPEHGESIEEQWVFRIIAPAQWPMLQWAIVDPCGRRPAYSYGFD